MNTDQKIDVVCASGTARVKNEHAVALGRMGGAAGKGASKVRTPDQCRKAAAARWEKYRTQKEK